MRTYRVFQEVECVAEHDAVVIEFNRQIPAVFAYGNIDDMNHMATLLNNRFPTDDGSIKP